MGRGAVKAMAARKRGEVGAYATKAPDDAVERRDADPACIRETLRRSGAAVKIEIDRL
jgi:hypothetical protein